MILFGRGKKASLNALVLKKRFRWKYENLRQLLRYNNELLETLAEMRSYMGGSTPDDTYSHCQISKLTDDVAYMVQCLNNISGDRFQALYKAHAGIASRLHETLSRNRNGKKSYLLLPLEAVDRSLASIVGGKAASLGELKRLFSENVPDGFIITTQAYNKFLDENNLNGQIRALYSRVDISNVSETEYICTLIKRFVENSLIPESISNEIKNHINSLNIGGRRGWAVRSSAVGEDGTFSFAGQFDSILNVSSDKLDQAYLKVVASRFKTSGVIYRLSNKIKEADCPMAVLFLKMIEAKSSGVIFTHNPKESGSDFIVISALYGLAADLLSGKVEADSFVCDRHGMKVIEQAISEKRISLGPADEGGVKSNDVPDDSRFRPALSSDEIKMLVDMAAKIENYFGQPMEIEWAIDVNNRIWILQARPMALSDKKHDESDTPAGCRLLAEGGATVSAGRAQGRLRICSVPQDIPRVQTGEILLVENAGPEVISVFNRISGIIAEKGHMASHAAAMAREYGIPGLFSVEGVQEKLAGAVEIGLDATSRKIYAGLPWPYLPIKLSTASASGQKEPSALEKSIFQLNLIDPAASNFTPQGCLSLHDIIRFIHEKAVAELFQVGDGQVAAEGEGIKVLDTVVPLNLTVFHIGNVIDRSHAGRKKIRPQEIKSDLFHALWRGLENSQIKWSGRTNVEIGGLASVFRTSVAAEGNPERKLGDRNYLIVGRDYLNLNARLAYHYSMIDAYVCDSILNNYVSIRFRGGGAGRNRRALRAKFIAAVLSLQGFSVDRRGDLVTAWYRGYDKASCNARLEMLGKLMGCSRQLDMLFDTKDKVDYYVEQFMNSNYKVFE